MVAYPISPAATPWSSGAMDPGMCSGLGGLGDGEVATSIVSTAGGILAGTAPLWTTATWAIPVIGAAVAGITLALVAYFNRKGPKQKVATTQEVNAMASQMEANKAAYMAGPHTVSSQAQALANFDAMWAHVTSMCGDPEMGDPGRRCIFERQRQGTCTTQQASEAHESIGDCGKYDMARDNRDPIANDPNVVPDPTVLDTAGASVESALSSIGLSGGGGTLLLAGAALLLAFSMGDSK